jgi:TolA-binding protein
MFFDLVFTPEPEPTMSPLPEIPAEVTDFSAAISGIVGAVLLVIAGLAWRKASAWFAEVTADVKATKIQTSNSHDTNLRDDLTLAITEVQGLSRAMKRVESKQGDMQTEQQQMHEDLRETRRDLRFTTEYVRDVDKRFISHVDDERKKDGGNND